MNHRSSKTVQNCSKQASALINAHLEWEKIKIETTLYLMSPGLKTPWENVQFALKKKAKNSEPKPNPESPPTEFLEDFSEVC